MRFSVPVRRAAVRNFGILGLRGGRAPDYLRYSHAGAPRRTGRVFARAPHKFAVRAENAFPNGREITRIYKYADDCKIRRAQKKAFQALFEKSWRIGGGARKTETQRRGRRLGKRNRENLTVKRIFLYVCCNSLGNGVSSKK